MPRGIYIRTKEYREKQKKAHLGKKPHPNSLKNLTHKYKKGYHHTEKEKENHRQWMLKNNPFRGKKHSEETKKNFKFRRRLFGKDHPRWRGGITELRKSIKQCFKYRQWRSDIFTRDGWRCVNCGEKIRAIEADHIKELAKILKEYGIKTIEQAIECEELWDINNGRTLCRECHEKRHKRLKNLKNRPKSKL